MEIRAATSTAVGPWIALAVVLGLAALLLAGLAVALIGRSPRAGTDAAEGEHDDLPDFLENPPGFASPGSAASAGFVALAAPPSPPPGAVPERSRRPHAVIAGGAAVLVAAAAVLVTVWAPSSSAGRPHRADRHAAGESRAARDVEARLTFAGVVLEERAVGVTVTYPEIEVTRDADGAVARLTLPTWNCLTTDAPEDPSEAGCVRGRTEYADLRGPDLEMARDAGSLRFSGDFATSTHPTGSPPEPTDRVYAVTVDVTPEARPRNGRWTHATGVLELADRQAESIDGEMRVRD